MQVRFPSGARDFPPRVNFQCRLSFSVHTSLCANTCINIYVHIKDPVVLVEETSTLSKICLASRSRVSATLGPADPTENAYYHIAQWKDHFVLEKLSLPISKGIHP